MKTISRLLICINVGALTAVGHASAQTQPDVYDFFRLGETTKACLTFSYNRAIADQIAEKYETHFQLYKKAGAPEDVLSAFKDYKDAVIKLPWKKPFGEWSDAQKKSWDIIEIGRNQREEWFKSVSDHGFNFWLGFVSMQTAHEIGQRLFDRQNAISQSAVIRNAGNISETLQTAPVYAQSCSKANPAVLEALKQIASISAKLDDPFAGEFSNADITALGNAGLQLRSLARDKKLVK